MLKKYLFIAAAIFAVIGFQSQAFAVPTSELVFTADMTKEQLQAELAKADDIEAAVTAAIVAGASAVDVVRAAIKADPAKAQNIKARAVAASPRSEKKAIVAAADSQFRIQGILAFNLSNLTTETEAIASVFYGFESYRSYDYYSALLGLSGNYTSGGGGLTSANIATQAANG